MADEDLYSREDVSRSTGMRFREIDRAIAQDNFPRPIVQSGLLRWCPLEIESWLAARFYER
jgi:predicted DNA-binding transcriptional regulator AlpA